MLFYIILAYLPDTMGASWKLPRSFVGSVHGTAHDENPYQQMFSQSKLISC